MNILDSDLEKLDKGCFFLPSCFKICLSLEYILKVFEQNQPLLNFINIVFYIFLLCKIKTLTRIKSYLH